MLFAIDEKFELETLVICISLPKYTELYTIEDILSELIAKSQVFVLRKQNVLNTILYLFMC
jgi:hypothetical protein